LRVKSQETGGVRNQTLRKNKSQRSLEWSQLGKEEGGGFTKKINHQKKRGDGVRRKRDLDKMGKGGINSILSQSQSPRFSNRGFSKTITETPHWPKKTGKTGENTRTRTDRIRRNRMTTARGGRKVNRERTKKKRRKNGHP